MVIVIPALIVTALTYLAAFGIIGIGGSVVTWSIVEIMKMIAIGIVGLGFLLIGMWLFWKKRNQLGDIGKGDIKKQIGLLIPIILLLVGGMFLDPQGFGVALLPIFHIAFFVLGFLLIWKFVIPFLTGKLKTKLSTPVVAICGMAAMFFFVLGIPGVVFSLGGSTMAMSVEGAAIANVEGPNVLAPVMSIGGMIWPSDPSLGIFILAAVIGLAGAFILKGKKWRS